MHLLVNFAVDRLARTKNTSQSADADIHGGGNHTVYMPFRLLHPPVRMDACHRCHLLHDEPVGVSPLLPLHQGGDRGTKPEALASDTADTGLAGWGYPVSYTHLKLPPILRV